MRITKNIHIKLSALLAVCLAVFACSEDKIPDTYSGSFIIFEQDSILINVLSETEVKLPVLVCAAPHSQAINVGFEVYSDSLLQGADFIIDQTDYQLSYPVGVFNDTIKVSFDSDRIYPDEVYKVSFTLLDNSARYILGFPGPNQQHVSSNIYLIKSDD